MKTCTCLRVSICLNDQLFVVVVVVVVVAVVVIAVVGPLPFICLLFLRLD